jgi:phosphohistidine phosphatase
VKTLYLVRHAKSTWDDPGLNDQDRPLNPRGRRDARDMAQRLLARGVSVDLIISSPALRALTTVRELAQGFDYPADLIRSDAVLYFGEFGEQLGLIKRQPEIIDSLMLTGHNPDITLLLNFLCGKQTESVPTCSVATINLDCNWSDITGKVGVLKDYDFPRTTKPD